jgi:hypothetical protein
MSDREMRLECWRLALKDGPTSRPQLSQQGSGVLFVGA